jgi:hypothetical protein
MHDDRGIRGPAGGVWGSSVSPGLSARSPDRGTDMLRMKPVSSEIPPPPISAFDAAILEDLTEHVAGEAAILDEYRQLAMSPDPPVPYLAHLRTGTIGGA